MADTIPAAKVTFNSNRGRPKGSNESEQTKILKGLLKEFKTLTGLAATAAKMGGGSGGGLLTMLLSGTKRGAIAGGVGGIGLLAWIGQKLTDFKDPENPIMQAILGKTLPNYYEKGYTEEGEEIVLRINKKSNLIEETISKEEAIRRGILEVTGEIASHLDTQNSDWDIITKDMKKYKGAVILSGENLDLISAETEKQKVLEIEITRLTRLRAEQMAKTANDEVRAVTINRGSGNMSIGYDKLTILEQVSMEMSMKSEDPRQREYIDSLQSTGPQSNILFDVAYDNRQSR